MNFVTVCGVIVGGLLVGTWRGWDGNHERLWEAVMEPDGAYTIRWFGRDEACTVAFDATSEIVRSKIGCSEPLDVARFRMPRVWTEEDEVMGADVPAGIVLPDQSPTR